MKKRKRIILKNKKRFYTLIIIIIIPIILFIFANSVFALSDKNDIVHQKIIVRSNDTLWDIAATYMNKDDDIRKYIYKIKSINYLASSDIYVGQELFLPCE